MICLKYYCGICGFEYDEKKGDDESGIPPGTAYDDLPEDYVCPACGVKKENFVPYKKAMK